MTICCAIHDPISRETWIGSDSRATSNTFIWPEKVKKWIAAGKWRVANCGSGRALHLMEKRAKCLAACPDVSAVCGSLRDILQEDGWRADDEKGAISYGPLMFLLASHEGVWIIPSNFAPVYVGGRFAAIGSGDDFAYGAAHALMALCVSREVVVRSALHAACTFDAACGGDLFIDHLRGE
jgi:ATP-dependent protease HslVU (ClpYQ) peptidase subunit